MRKLVITQNITLDGAIEMLDDWFDPQLADEDLLEESHRQDSQADALLVAKRGVDGVYDSDPNVDPDAKRFTNLTYREALAAGVKVMDESAFVLANEHGLLMHVFDVAALGAMSAICQGEDIGTRITAHKPDQGG